MAQGHLLLFERTVSAPRIHTVAYNHLLTPVLGKTDASFWPLNCTAHTWYTYTFAGHTQINDI